MKFLFQNIDITKIKTFLWKEKEEVMELLGHGFNYWHTDIWSYNIQEKFWEKERHFVLIFEDNIVKQVYIKKYYFWNRGV